MLDSLINNCRGNSLSLIMYDFTLIHKT